MTIHKDETQKQGKTTSEKPVSLHPLKLDEALRDLLAIKPPKDHKDKDGREKKSRK